jgi:SAM-dependent methyltransferase
MKQEGEKGIQAEGHRAYVGGLWEEIGKLQFDFLVQSGLKPTHCFLDIACGSLRAGVHLVKYLDVGNYLGIDKESKLIELGIENELGKALYAEKKPEFVVSSSFEFNKFSKKPQFSIAQSLFTHLSVGDIKLCLRNLRQIVDQNHVLFATFREGDSLGNQMTSHSRACFEYSKIEMANFSEGTGFRATYIGKWGHPRGQLMMKYEAL